MKNILLFASGGGSNVKAILDYFANNEGVHFPLIITNNAKAGVIQIAKSYNIDILVISKNYFNSSTFIAYLEALKPSLLVLAGFLWKIPEPLITHFPKNIINIHPALLPKYGGKGMYGHFVHEAVVANKETETGITIHYVNEHYDDGTIILQQSIQLIGNENTKEVATLVLKLEHQYYPVAIEKLIH
jgi:phosphoribosylglycinamide formyltransferase 1